MINSDYSYYRFKRDNLWGINLDMSPNNQRAVPSMTKNGLRKYKELSYASEFNKWEFQLASGTKMMLGHSLYYSDGTGRNEK